MSRRLLLLTLLAAGCGRATAPVRPMIAATSETQLTTAPHGHILTNTAVWSPDSQWIVYDVRSDPAGSVFDGTRIERVNVRTKQIEVLYESKNGACVGVATVNPVDGRVVFIHGPENPTPDWSYSPCHREGVIVDPKKPGVVVLLEARDIVPPFTPGALRGGTHVHTWDETGRFVSFTYEDHVLTHGPAEGKEPNRRTIGVAEPFDVRVPQTHPRNRHGTYRSELVAKTVPKPKPGSDEIGRAFEEGWLPDGRGLSFIGEVVAKDGRTVNELFVLLIERDQGVDRRDSPSPGTESTLPEVSADVKQFRMTYFATQPDHRGLTTSPRHWPRANRKGWIAFLTGDGRLHSVNCDRSGGMFTYAATWDSAFTWHPNSRHLAAIVYGRVFLFDTGTNRVTFLTKQSDPPPRPEACVVSPDGTMIAFVRPVNGFNQIFTVNVPSEAVK